MTQIAILNGIYSDQAPDFRTSYPRNMVPVPKQTGVNQGYLRPGDGIVLFGTGPGVDRGGINWKGTMYRVQGTKLVKVDSVGAVTVLGDVGGSGPVTMDYSFDVLSISSNDKLFYWDGMALTQVTDTDLGSVIDHLWTAGYFMTTDGTSLVVTELNNRMEVNPLKYGSSESDPDPINALLLLRNEVYALNRNTIEVFQNVGGNFFPFQRIDGAQVTKGCIGTYACCVFVEAIAFMGSGRNEAPSIYIAANGQAAPLATREIDQILLEYTEEELSGVVIEARVSKAHQHLYVHLPNRTLVYDAAATKAVGEPIWFTLDSGLGDVEQYVARSLVWCYDKWLAGDPTSGRIGQLADNISSHYGAVTGWDFGTLIVYNGGRGAIFVELELCALTGRVVLGQDPTIWTSYSMDGVTWSQERSISAGILGNTLKRLCWRSQGMMQNMRMQRFRGTSDTHVSFARLEVQLEALYG